MGIIALRSSRAEATEGEGDEVIALLDEMIKKEEEFEKCWKGYL